MQRFCAPTSADGGVCTGSENFPSRPREKNDAAGHAHHPHRDQTGRFSQVVLLQIAGRWHVVETVEQAMQCLWEKFTGHGEPSVARVMTTYQSLQAGLVTVDAFLAAFIVAAMSAGYRYELHEIGYAMLERRVATAAENALLEVLLGPEV